jgi:hypothetical protein
MDALHSLKIEKKLTRHYNIVCKIPDTSMKVLGSTAIIFKLIVNKLGRRRSVMPIDRILLNRAAPDLAKMSFLLFAGSGYDCTPLLAGSNPRIGHARRR